MRRTAFLFATNNMMIQKDFPVVFIYRTNSQLANQLFEYLLFISQLWFSSCYVKSIYLECWAIFTNNCKIKASTVKGMLFSFTGCLYNKLLTKNGIPIIYFPGSYYAFYSIILKLFSILRFLLSIIFRLKGKKSTI